MSQPDVTGNSRTFDQPTSPQSGAAPPSGQMWLKTMPQDHATLVAQLQQVLEVSQQRLNRISQLEQALDQALACLTDLQQAAQEKTFLENQLAVTEDFANVQQQAIARLQQQQAQHQQQIELHGLEVQTRDQAIAELQATLEAKDQKIAELEAELGDRQAQMAEVQNGLTQTQQQVDQLTTKLEQAQKSLTDLEAQLEYAYSNLDDQQNMALTLRRAQTIAAERNTRIAMLQKDLAIAQIKVEELETQLARHRQLEAKWQQSAQELEVLSERYQQQVTELKQEVTQMQEQIFQSVCQSHEHETAVQHWKDRYLASQRQLLYFKQLLDAAIPQPSPDDNFDSHLPVTPALLELLTAIQMVNATEQIDPVPLPSLPMPHLSTLDFPDFLIRRRSLRAREVAKEDRS